MDAVKVQQIITELTNAGWTNLPVGHYKSSNQVKQITGFELDADQMRRIDELDRGEEGRTGPRPDEMDRL